MIYKINMKKEVNKRLKQLKGLMKLNKYQEEYVKHALTMSYQQGQIDLLLKQTKQVLKETKKQFADTAPIYEK